MGIFDIDSGADNHLLNEQFHVFSKSPASVATALGDASNRSGHTVTASDVWGQEIPAFFYAKTQEVANTYKALAKTNDLCRIGNSVAIFENGDWSVKYNSYTDIPDGHKFKNAAGDDVIRFHKNRLAYNLNLDNNAADDGLDTTAKIQGWDEENGKVYDYVATAPKFVSQFVTSTDKIVDGIPSKGFGPFVMAGTTTGDITKVLPEGTSDSNHYIANSFAGIIQFNKARTDAIYVHAFEYCGKTLKSAYGDIKQHSDEISTIKASLGLEETPGTSSLGSRVSDNEAALRTLIGLESDAKVVASESITATANNAAKAAVEGVNVTSTGSNGVVASQVKSVVSLEVTPATVAASGAITENADNVVTATGAKAIADKAASDAITAALADTEGSAITEKIESEIAAATLPDGQAIATTTDTTKLVTVEDVKTYVENNAKVSINGGSGISVTPTGKATEFTVSVDTSVVATQTDVSTAKSELQGEIDKINTSLTSGTIHTEIDGVRQIANAAKNTADTAVQSVTRAADSSELITVTDGTDVTISLSTEVATKSDITTEIDKLTAEGGSVKALQTKVGEIETSLATGGTTANAIKAAQDAADAAQTTANQGVTDAAAALAEAQKRISKVSEGTDSGLLTVETTGTEVTITLDGDVATKTHVAGEIKTVTDAATALTTRVETAEGTIKTLVETTVPAVKTIAEQGVADAKAADDKAVAAANAVTTLGSTTITEQSVSGAGIAVTLKGSVKAPTLEGSVTTASYTKAAGETPGSWTDEAKVVTGATVKDALADVASAHSKDIQTLQTAINGLTTTGLIRQVLPNGQTTADITEPKANVIYLVKDTKSETGAYVEYLYVDGTFEAIGTTSTDLSEYAKTGGSTKTIADLAAEVATAQSEVDALETSFSTFTLAYASEKSALEDSIKAVSDKVGTDSVATQIDTKLSALTDKETQGGAGVTLKQENGKVTLTVVSGAVDETGKSGADKFVKGETVYAAIAAQATADAAAYAVKGTETVAKNAADAAATAQETAEAKIESITTSGDLIILTPTTSNKVKSVAIALASTVATTTDGTAYSKGEIDGKVTTLTNAIATAQDAADAAADAAEAAQTTANSKIAAVEVTTDAATHLGAHHISATTDADKKVTVAVSCSDEWEYTGAALTTVTSVINGKMSDGKTIDDANLTSAEGMFAGNTALTTFVGDLGKLTTGTNMFSGCTGLTTFCGNLSSLTEGTGMFAGCALDEDSLIYIVDSLPDRSGEVTTATITVGVAASVTNKAIYATEAATKGWQLK